MVAMWAQQCSNMCVLHTLGCASHLLPAVRATQAQEMPCPITPPGISVPHLRGVAHHHGARVERLQCGTQLHVHVHALVCRARGEWEVAE